jgi:ADP-heptose:LPS heptosyltransferase
MSARHLVVQLARFGDILQTKRLMQSLAVREDIKAHLLVDTGLVELARLVYPDAVIHGVTAHGTKKPSHAEFMQNNLHTFAELSSLKFDTVYNLNFSGLNFAVAGLFESGQVVGYRLRNGGWERDQWTSMAFRWAKRRKATGLNLVDFWGFFAEHPVSPGEVNPIAMSKGGGIGVVMAGRMSRRSLPPDLLARITAAVLQGTGSEKIFLLGTAGERRAAKDLLDALPRSLHDKVENLVGKTSFTGLMDIVSGLDVLLTPDTGTMHLAAHLGTPVQAFFLSSAWCFETGPYGLGHRVWQAQADCVPCMEMQPCPHEQLCLSPFAGKELLKHLAGNPTFELQEGLTGYVALFDQLGIIYRPVLGIDPEAERRKAFREALTAFTHSGMPKSADVSADEVLFLEKDWVFDQANNCLDISE